MDETLRALIAGVTEGAAEGVAALRRHGLELELDVYSVEARLGEGTPTASIRLDFVVPSPGIR